MGQSTQKVNRSSQQLSSGDRILNSAVDPSGLAISEKLKAGIRSFGQARRNINDGISLLQVAEGDLANIMNLAIRMKELSVAASSDTLSNDARSAVDAEFQSIKTEIDRTAKISNFNGLNLLNGDDKKFDFQVGIHGQTGTNTIVYSTKDLTATADELGISGAEIRSKAGAQMSLGKIDRMITKINAKRSEAGSLSSRLMSSISNNEIQNESFAAGNSRIRDTDVAQAVSEQASQSIIQGATVGMLKEINGRNKNVERLLS